MSKATKLSKEKRFGSLVTSHTLEHTHLSGNLTFVREGYVKKKKVLYEEMRT